MPSFKVKIIIKLTWLIIAIAVFIHHVYLLILVKYYDYDFFMLEIDFMKNAMATNILTFPMSAIAIPIIAIIHFLHIPMSGVIDEAIILILGYIQWFIIVPWILQTPKEKYKKNDTRKH
jgi:hypothetical protein